MRDTVQNMDCLICWTTSDTLIDHIIVHLSPFGHCPANISMKNVYPATKQQWIGYNPNGLKRTMLCVEVMCQTLSSKLSIHACFDGHHPNTWMLNLLDSIRHAHVHHLHTYTFKSILDYPLTLNLHGYYPIHGYVCWTVSDTCYCTDACYLTSIFLAESFGLITNPFHSCLIQCMDICWTVSNTCTCTDASYLTSNFLDLLDTVQQSDVKLDEHAPSKT